MANPPINRYGRPSGFGRGRTTSIRNVPRIGATEGVAGFYAIFNGAQMQSMIRDLKGRFIARGQVAQVLTAAHNELAVSAGLFMVRAYDTRQRKIGRPQNRQHLFREAIMARGNRLVTPTEFGVGYESWYARSPAALYWRYVEEGGVNPMVKVLAEGAISGFFWNPFRAGPGKAPFRSQGRFKWKHLDDVPPEKGGSPRDILQYPGAIAGGTPRNPDNYMKRRYNVAVHDAEGNITGNRQVTLYFHKPENVVSKFGNFEGYGFHVLGARRFLNARPFADVYRRRFAEAGIPIEVH